VESRIRGVGGLSPALVAAFRSVLRDDRVDGAFKAFALGLPADTELLAAIPEADPCVLHEVSTAALEGARVPACGDVPRPS
jgi:hypothetical protein